MPKQYSIAEARKHLPGIVRAVEVGPPVRLTRRGRPVAVVMPLAEYHWLTAEKKGGFWVRLQAFRREADLEAIWAEGDPWADVRDRSTARDTDANSTFWERLQDFRRRMDIEGIDIPPETWERLRDRSSSGDGAL